MAEHAQDFARRQCVRTGFRMWLNDRFLYTKPAASGLNRRTTMRTTKIYRGSDNSMRRTRANATLMGISGRHGG